MAQVLEKKSPGLQQHRILQLNANSIHGELPLLENLIEAADVDVVCIQEAKLQPKDKPPELRNFSTVRRDRPVHGEARGESL